MIARTLPVLAAAAFVAGAAAAATVDGINLSDDGRTAQFAKGSAYFMPPPVHDRATKTIFSNIGAKYPKGEYFCCFGDTISGVDSVIKSQNWVAAQFASLNDVMVTEIDVAAEWAS